MPAGRPPNPLTPDASLAHAVGAQIRALREEAGLTLEELGRRAGYTPQHVSAAEQAKSTLSLAFLEAIDVALGAHGVIASQHEALVVEHARKRANASAASLGCAQEVDDVRRRQMLKLGLCAVLLGPEAAAHASAEEWDRVAHVWGHELAVAHDRAAMLPGLLADLKRNPPPRTYAVLCSYGGMIAVTSGNPSAAKNFWRRARAAAARADDPQVAAYVGGKQAVQGLYGVYSPAQVVLLAEDAIRATGSACTGRMEALGARAQALAVLHRTRQARAAYATLEAEFERLPRVITQERISPLGFPAERMLNSRSFGGMFIGGGEPAREEALRLYDTGHWRGRTQVLLHRAAEDRNPAYAEEVLSGLNDAQRADSFVRRIARRAA